ncbi:hypothetical protein AB8A20_07915 [Tardiphaga sp. 604_B6_N1_1]|uniref:hypothetical protein n=1 Tax=unclassified Tardiphaga TaxID=2631404 RepID=UPI003F22CAA4
MTKKNLILPGWPRGLSREFAAAYIGVSASLFDEMVRDGRMPPAKQINRRKVWDVLAIDAAFTALDDAEGTGDFKEADLAAPANLPDDRIDGKTAKPSGIVWFDEERDRAWAVEVRSRPLGKKERSGLEGYVRGKSQHKLQVKGAGPDTIDRLLIRGYIEVESERGEGKEPYYGVTVAGEEAWQQLEASGL